MTKEFPFASTSPRRAAVQKIQEAQSKPIKVREYRKKRGITVAAHARSEATEKPQAYVQLFYDVSAVVATAYTRDITDGIDTDEEIEICMVDAGLPDDADDEACTKIGESLLPQLLNKLRKKGYGRKFHRLEDMS
jgi:hypothetical protein